MLAVLVTAATLCVSGTARDADLAPLYCPQQAVAKWRGKDGSKLSAGDRPKGFVRTCLIVAERHLGRRDENLATAAEVVAELEELLDEVERTKGDPTARSATREELEEMRDGALVRAETALLQAVTFETKRLDLIHRAIQAEAREERRFDRVDPELVARLLERHQSGEAEKVARAYMTALKLVVAGIIGYLDDDMVGAIANAKQAAKACPELPTAFLYLGSFSIIVDQRDSAIDAWKRLLTLQPNNTEVRQALRSLGVRTLPKPIRKKRRRRR